MTRTELSSLDKGLAELVAEIEAHLRKCESEPELQRAHAEGISRITTQYREWLSSQGGLSPKNEKLAQKIAVAYDLKIRKVQRQERTAIRQVKYRRIKERRGNAEG